jgi:hypothetical protein
MVSFRDSETGWPITRWVRRQAGALSALVVAELRRSGRLIIALRHVGSRFACRPVQTVPARRNPPAVEIDEAPAPAADRPDWTGYNAEAPDDLPLHSEILGP